MVFLVLVFIYFRRRQSKKAQPPELRALLMIGHFHLLMEKDVPAHHVLYSLPHYCYNPIMNLKFDSGPVLVTSSSQLAEECLSGANDTSSASCPHLAAGNIVGYDFSMLGWIRYFP
eukprot:Gb_28206 [translate_table: standard]